MACCAGKKHNNQASGKKDGIQLTEEAEKKAIAALDSSPVNLDALEAPKPEIAKGPAARIVDEVKETIEDEVERKPLMPAWSNDEFAVQDIGGIDLVPVEELDDCVDMDGGGDAAEAAVKRERAAAREAGKKAAEAAEGGEGVASPKVRSKPKTRT
eukprot:GEMP01034119.1.p1 GENE.GEMP01034119.1~~GEMP01034119.1.p1  ORF type:complete len:156 (+),score=63.05 GEMP01034119.1:165-632(+)